MMPNRYLRLQARFFGVLLALCLTACGESAQLPLSASFGAKPQLPPPNPTWIPTVKIAPAIGWPTEGKPIAANGLEVKAFARGLEHPRWLYVLPNGDVLVAETSAPAKSEETNGITDWLMQRIMQRAGAIVPSANRITLLRDADHDGVAETRSVFLQGLNSPFGMALVQNTFYVANTDAVMQYTYHDGDMRITSAGSKLLDLPAGELNYHWTKNILASPDGKYLYVTIGSNSNVAENGIEQEAERAAIWEVDRVQGKHQVYASGLRNPNGLGWEPTSGELWTVVNERDEIGSDLVPDYLTSVQRGSFFGWPYSYFGQHVDVRVQSPRPDLVAAAQVPDYALGTHTASLGLAFSAGSNLPAPFNNGAFIGQHGSWNRDPMSGYQVIFIPFKAGKPAGEPVTILTGFVSPKGNAFGRPVGVSLDKQSALLVADDVGNTIWRVDFAHHPTAPGSP